ncbi:MAG: ImmA/IrrE family metallo-endopeptidase [Oscillospiraceae bacterium]|nr:ImmA/IrrE family metallo-endopeptidase [Oscillospiraceae bacterium]
MDRISQSVEELVWRYETSDPWQLCEKLGIIVVIADLPDGVRGLYHRVDEQQIICINKLVDTAQMRMVCAHELGHAVLHENSNMCTGLKATVELEQEAEAFKLQLLCVRMFGAEFRTFEHDEIIEFANLAPDSFIMDF